MSESSLEVTFRHGGAVAAYLYLPRRAGEKSHRTLRSGQGPLVDFSRSGKPIGIEITAPTRISLTSLNRVLKGLGLAKLSRSDLAPLRAA